MTHVFGKVVAIAVGGSVLYPGEGIDIRFLKSLKVFFTRHTKAGRKFIVVTGGGYPARLYQKVAKELGHVSHEELDLVGIQATRANAYLLRIALGRLAGPRVIHGRGEIKRLWYPVTISSGWRPGWSTDYDAVALAVDFKAPEVVIAGNPAYVYDRHPGKYASASPLHSLTWKDYLRLVPSQWKPGLHAPVDPVAARLAAREGITAIIVNGRDLKNLGNLLQGKAFRGTIIADADTR